MNRREIPLIEMIDGGREDLQKEGFVMMWFKESFAKDPTRLNPHYHHFFQVSLLNGPGRLMHDFREAELDGDTLLFLSPGQVHTVKPAPGTDGTIVSFTREFYGDGAGKLLEMPFFYATNAMPWMRLGKEDAGPVRALFQEMHAEFGARKPGADEMLRSLLRILFVKAARLYDAAGDAPGGKRGNALVREFHQAVELHFNEWQALEPYAKLLGVTANHLNDMIREVTGESAGSHIRARRLLDAKRLLLYSELSVSEVGYHLGFNDPSYFSRFFRRYEELTPAEFRNQIREKYQKVAD